jgi:S1-C subfamily serine protease
MSQSPLLALSDALADAVGVIAPSVVQVHGRRRPASGVVSGTDLVITTARAVGREDGVRVTTGDGQTHAADVAGWDAATSLVLLRVNGLAAPPAPRAAADPRVGQLALAVARSWSNAVTASSGIVSVIGGPLPTGHGGSIERVIRTDAPMHGGFAGGAFVDAAGELVGLTTAAEIRGLGVVLPADLVWKTAAALAAEGTPRRGYLGLSSQPVALPARQRTGGRDQALLVAGVAAGSPADAAGLLVGDIITPVDGRPVRSPVDLLDLLHGDRVGQTVAVELLRGGAALTVDVTIGERPRPSH